MWSVNGNQSYSFILTNLVIQQTVIVGLLCPSTEYTADQKSSNPTLTKLLQQSIYFFNLHIPYLLGSGTGHEEKNQIRCLSCNHSIYKKKSLISFFFFSYCSPSWKALPSLPAEIHPSPRPQLQKSLSLPQGTLTFSPFTHPQRFSLTAVSTHWFLLLLKCDSWS